MSIDREILNKVEDTLNTTSSIEEVKVSPFFKEKTMQRLFFNEQKETFVAWSWFTPKLQLAVFIGIIILNVMAFKGVENTSNYNEELNEFAEAYGLFQDTNDISF